MLAISLLLAQAAAPAAPPATAPAPKPAPTGPFVALDVTQGRTALGTITIALNEEKAPISVKNFLSYVRAGHYDGTVFHRVMPNFMIQGGGYTPELEEKPTQAAIRNEARNGLRNSRGTVAMARLNEPNSATSQFFINVRDNHMLDFGMAGAGYAVFGEVVSGMDVVERIASVPTTSRGPHQNVPQVAVVIKKAREVKAPPTAEARPSEPAKP
ncbi:MAG TPA: peptidylprolyl isomerase [Vicinamibacteria bacterium]|nr:peptidylprolyl isomerase [Vicinamibacteria bacterium]